jgi:hypothetical protein
MSLHNNNSVVIAANKKVTWLQDNAMNITQLSVIEGDSFSDLHPLNLLSNKDVVFLGGNAHEDGTHPIHAF